MGERLRNLRHAAGANLSCLEAGPPDGPLVLLLHGFPEDAESLGAQIDALAAAGFRVVAPDQRGYGGSDRPRGLDAYRLDALADDVVALACVAGRERFDLLGHDWGGVVAWRVAAMHPDRVRRLAILNAPHLDAMGAYMRRTPAQLARSAYIALFQPPWLPEALLGARGSLLLRRTLIRTSRAGAFSPAELGRLRRAWSRPGALTAMLNWYRALGRRSRAPWPRVQAPTLVLWGARDAFLGRGLAAAGAALCDDARLLYLEDAGHWLHREAADQVNAALTRFLQGEAVGEGAASVSGPERGGS